jgi:hypothetical protein
MRNFIIKRTLGEDANLPVLRCEHFHHKSEISGRHAGRHDHCREECDFDHDFYGQCPEIPLCYHDGDKDHDKSACKFRHTGDSKQSVVHKVAPAPMPVAQPQSPLFKPDDFVPLTLSSAAPKAAAASWADEVDEHDLEIAELDKQLAQAVIDKAAKEEKKKKDAETQKKLQIIAEKKALLAALQASLAEQ